MERPDPSENLDNCIGESGNKASHGAWFQDDQRQHLLWGHGGCESIDDGGSVCVAGDLRNQEFYEVKSQTFQGADFADEAR